MKSEKRENVLAGLVGAFLGSLIGVASIVIIGQLGYIASISGLILAVCAMKGYELLGGAMSRKGAVIASILTLIMTYLGNHLNFAVAIARLDGTDVFFAFQDLGRLLKYGYINVAAYWGNLVMLYIFTLLGSVPTLTAAFRRATPVSAPPESDDPQLTPEAPKAVESDFRVYPFHMSWTRKLRMSLCLPVFLFIGIWLCLLLALTANEAFFSTPLLLALLCSIAGPLLAFFYLLAWLSPFQSPQFVFVRTNGELWRVDLAQLNRIEPYRFSAKLGAWRVLRWEILTEEEQRRASHAIKRVIHSIRAQEIMPDSILRRIVLYLPDLQIEKETKWVWKVSYALNSVSGNRRRKMTIGKAYPGFSPVPGAAAPEAPVPARWTSFFLSLALSVVMAGVGAMAGFAMTGELFDFHKKEQAQFSPVRPESFVLYEQNGVLFSIDRDFQNTDYEGQFTDPSTGTVYMLGVYQGADEEMALDSLLEPIGEFRKSASFQDFSFAYRSEEEDFTDLTAEDGSVYRHNLLTIHFTDGQTLHNGVSLSDSGILIQIMAIQNEEDEEERVAGVIRYLLTTLTIEEPWERSLDTL